jgi:fibronectin type 3 domain-containing protein
VQRKRDASTRSSTFASRGASALAALSFASWIAGSIPALAQAPPAPIGLLAESNYEKVTLGWNPSSGASQYTVQRAASAGGPYGDVPGCVAVPFSTCTASGLANGTVSYFRVKAGNASAQWSEPSQYASAAPSQLAPKNAPTNLRASFVSGTQVKLSWAAPAAGGGATVAYNIQWSTRRGGPYANIYTGSSSRSYSHTGLTPGPSYYYRVQAASSPSLRSHPSNAPSDPDVGAPTVAPPPPSDLRAFTASSPLDAKTHLEWSSVPDALVTRYSVKASSRSGIYAGSGFDAGAATSYVDAAPVDAGRYYVVTATNAAGTSSDSAEVFRPATPAGLAAVAASGQVMLTWAATPGATSYQVYRGTSSGLYDTTRDAGDATSYVDSEALDGTTYYYAVKASSQTPARGTSPYSDEAPARPSSVAWVGTANGNSHVPGATILALFSRMPNLDDEGVVTMVEAGAVTSVLGQSARLLGQTSGTRRFTATRPGTYVLRAYATDVDPGAATLTAQSDPFTVTATGSSPPDPQATATVTAGSATVEVRWRNLGVYVGDLLTLVESSAPPGTAAQSTRLDARPSGSATLAAPRAGTYQLRVYADGDRNRLVYTSASFTTTGTTEVAANLTNPSGDDVALSWTRGSGYDDDVINVVPHGSPAATVGWTASTNGQPTGALGVPGLADGYYVARYHRRGDFSTHIAESQKFAVGEIPAIAVGATSHATGAAIQVSFSGFPARADDEIVLAPAGSTLATRSAARPTGALASNLAAIEAILPPGTYVARGVTGAGGTLLVESSPFTVTPASGFWPAAEARVPIDTFYAWSAAPLHTKFTLRIRRKDTGALAFTQTYARAGVCSGRQCLLSPGMAGYPAGLETRAYDWTVLAFNGATWTTTGPSASTFYLMPSAPTGLTAIWTGNMVDMTWPRVPGAASYRTQLYDVRHVPSGKLFDCAGPAGAACAGSMNVAHIKDGTIVAALSACGYHGRCTAEVSRAETFKACAPGSAELVMGLPRHQGTMRAGDPFAWNNAGGERFSIQVHRGSELLLDERPWRSEINCSPTTCTRNYPLVAGEYTATVSTMCGGSWSPPQEMTFTVLSDPGAAPTTLKTLSPAAGQVTSITPTFIWAKAPDIRFYEIAIGLQNGAQTRFVTECNAELCELDYLDVPQAGLGGTAPSSWSVRVNQPDMPWSPAVAFQPSLAYAPAAPVVTSPSPGQNIGWNTKVMVTYAVEVQAGSFVSTLDPPSSGPWSFAAIDRRQCTLVSSLERHCAVATPTPLLEAGAYHLTVAADGVATTLDFNRAALTPGKRQIFTIFSQNAQFLPELTLPGLSLTSHILGNTFYKVSASEGWNMTDGERAAKLADYIKHGEFDIVALEEIFTEDAKVKLDEMLREPDPADPTQPLYPYRFGLIDVAGSHLDDEVALPTSIAGGFAGPLGAIPVFAASFYAVGGHLRPDSGLALYTKKSFAPIVDFSYNEFDETAACTDQFFNEIRNTTRFNSHLPRTRINFRRWCQCSEHDCRADKGMAAVKLDNKLTGIPMLLFWAHAQAIKADALGSYEASYHDRANGVTNDAKAGIEWLFKRAAHLHDRRYDAFVVGDWNTPMPRAVGGDTSLLYTGTLHYDENPFWNDVVDTGKGPGSGVLLFQQYRDFWDPSNSQRSWLFPDPDPATNRQLYDLWLGNPLGDRGYTFDPNRPFVDCNEAGEPCHERRQADGGIRFDTVFARLHAATSDAAHSYPGGSAGPSWGHARACVQHVRLAKEYKYADHIGTIIEVAPETPRCSWDRALRNPQATYPQGHANEPRYKGAHLGTIAFGGMNEWFFVDEVGSIDVVAEDRDLAGLPALKIEAFKPDDLSTLRPIAGGQEQVDEGGFLTSFCPTAMNGRSLADNGHLDPACSGPTTRVTFLVPPGGLYIRVRAGDATKSRACSTCVGAYTIRFLKRTCKVWYDAGVVGDVPRFGGTQKSCFFELNLDRPTRADDHQQLTVPDVFVANDRSCQDNPGGGTGSCPASYQVSFYPHGSLDLQDGQLEKPPATQQRLLPLITATSSSGPNPHVFTAGADWDVLSGAERTKSYRVKLSRDVATRVYPASFGPVSSNLKKVAFSVLMTNDVNDDDTITIPIIGKTITIDDATDEGRIELLVNGQSQETWQREFRIGAFSSSGMTFRPLDTHPHGLVVAFTQSARIAAEDSDWPSGDDALVADHLMCGYSGSSPPAPTTDWQSALFERYWQSKTWNMSPVNNRSNPTSATTTFVFQEGCGGTVRQDYKLDVASCRENACQ